MPVPAYVNSGVYERMAVSGDGVSGLTLPMPAALVIGNMLVAQFGNRATANFPDDTLVATQAGGGMWNVLRDFTGAVGERQTLYWKRVSSTSEPDLRILSKTNGTKGTPLCVGVVHQFSGLKVGSDFAEAAGATYFELVSGPVIDAAVAVTGPDRLAVQFICSTNALVTPSLGVSTQPAGYTWSQRFYGPTGLSPQLLLWTAPVTSPGTIDGGQQAGSAAGNTVIALGWAFAPCGAVPFATGTPVEKAYQANVEESRRRWITNTARREAQSARSRAERTNSAFSYLEQVEAAAYATWIDRLNAASAIGLSLRELGG